MYFIQVGIHYRTNEVAIREQFVFPQEALPLANEQLNKMPHLVENVILSTCNRTEIYAVVDEQTLGYASILDFLAKTFAVSRQQIEQMTEVRSEEDAITHLLRVTAGLDSMVLGETEILGQIKTAYFIAQKAQTTKKICNSLFHRAMTLGKQVHHQTKVNEHPVSISHLAVQLCAKTIPDFAKRRILVLGAGTMGLGTVKQLVAYNVADIVLLNRSVEKAKAQVQEDVKVLPYTHLQEEIALADVVFFAVGKETEVISKETATHIQQLRQFQASWFIDLAVPRNVDPAINSLPGITIYDMDYLQEVALENQSLRKLLAKKAEKLVEEMLVDILAWRKALPTHPILASLQEKTDGIEAHLLASVKRKIPTLTDREKRVIENHMKSMVNQLTSQAIKQLKEDGTKEDATLFLDYFTKIFGLPNDTFLESNSSRVKEKDWNNKKVGGI